ncbi:MAG TPA: DUF6624 domain-containing protein [Bryobacteraceae bacterium]
MRGYLIAISLCLTTVVRGQDITSQQQAWEKAVEARHDAFVKRWGNGSDPSLRKELRVMYARDQDARKFMMTLPPAQWTDSMGQQREMTDADLTLQLKKIVKRKGWPTFRMVGVNGANHALLILNHSADHVWQNEMLPQLEKLSEEGEIDAPEFAMFVDKVLV